MDLDKLKKAVIKGDIEWRKHALQRMFERNIKRSDVKEVILEGELIEQYKNDKPFPSFLFFKIVNDKPFHVLTASMKAKIRFM